MTDPDQASREAGPGGGARPGSPRPSGRLRAGRWLAGALVLALAAGSIAAAVAVWRMEAGERRELALVRAEGLRDEIAVTTAATIGTLRQLSSVAARDGEVAAAPFAAIAEEFLDEQALHGVVWAPLDGPRSGAWSLPLSRRAFRGPAPSLGTDMAAWPGVRTAVERAAGTGQAVMTPPGRHPELGDDLASIVVLPVYRAGAPVGTPVARRAALTGVAAAVYRLDRLFSSAVGTLPRGTALAVVSQGRTVAGESVPDSAVRVPVAVAGQDLEVRAAEAGSTPLAMPLAIGVGGLVATGLVALALVAGDRRSRALDQAAREAETRRAAEEELARVFAMPLVGVGVTAPDGRWLRVNDRLCEIAGRGRDALDGVTWADLIHPSDAPAAAAELCEVMGGRSDGYSLQTRVVRPGGEVVHVRFSTRCARDAGGGVARMVALVEDVTAEVRAEESRRSADQQLRALVEQMPDGVVVVDGDGMIRQANAAAHRITGHDPGTLPGRPATIVLAPAGHPAASAAAAVADGRGGAPEHPEVVDIRRPGGGMARVELRMGVVETPDGAMLSIVLHDVTPLVRAERDARLERDRLEALVDALRDGLVVTDANGTLVGTNDPLCEMTGFSRDELIGTPIPRPFWPPEERARIAALVRRHLAGEPGDVDVTLMRRDGTRFPAAVRTAPVRMADGAVVGLLTQVRDISARVEAAERLRLSEAEYRLLADNASDLIARIAPDGTVLYASPSWERVLGVRPDDLVGRPLCEAGFDDDGLARLEAARTAIADGEQEVRITHRATAADGRPLWFEAVARPVAGPGGETVEILVSSRDVTARRRAEREEEALRRVAMLLAEDAPAGDVFGAVARETAALVEADCGMVVCVGDDGARSLVGRWGPAAAWCSGLGADGPGQNGLFDRVLADALSAGRPVASGDPADAAGDGSGGRWVAAAPVRAAGRHWGAVAAGGSGTGLARHAALRALSRFADLVSTAIATADARARLVAQATTDALTGLANRAVFQDRLEREFERARRYGRPLSLVLFDLDHFKDVNDAFGHPAGDRALVVLAGRLSGLARGLDLVARLGGEEFAWLMPETDAEGALAAAERARLLVEGEPLGEVGPLTLSAGVCDLPAADNPGDLYRLADAALYWAKTHGRNRCVRYDREGLALTSALERDHAIARFEKLASVRALARAIDARDASTQSHSSRVSDLACALAARLGWPAERLELLDEASRVHDVGKIGVPDDILFKPGPLSPAERQQVRRHATLGAQMLEGALSPEQVEWVRCHHERWDGHGYPRGLSGAEIPEGARILAVADAWDAMVGVRLYRPPLTPRRALEECRKGSGTQFWPAAVAALGELWEEGHPALTADADRTGP